MVPGPKHDDESGVDPGLILDLGDLLVPVPISPPDIQIDPSGAELGDGWSIDSQWTVADRGDKTPPDQARFVVVPWDHVPARPVIHPNPWQAKNGGKVKIDKSIPALSLSVGNPMTFEEASESARRMNQLRVVMES